jgi:cobalt-precorrin 5A hydrolase/precorrin-3B C17-methyltransferase
VFSIDLKAAEPAIHALAASLGVPARFLDRGALARETPRLATPSALVEREVGVAGVAEAAALAAAGPTGRLIVPKRKGERVTCAIALAPLGIDPQAIGRPQGRLLVVGIGPGAATERTLRAIGAIEAADELVGYGLYLDLVADLARDRLRHRFPLGAEEPRCRFALERAAQGRTVALVSSGDPGIYAMASLVVELIAQADDPAIVRIAVEIVPGVSAMQAAAAAAGAPLGHDFCAISLSDLLTPRAAILERLRAAAVSDLVVALYNPVSARRRELLDEARTILLERRPATTPVILARALGRAEQQLRILALADLQVEMVDMLTVVLIGSTATRLVPRLHGPPFVVTPRGYALP